jgi:hypothetical protein
MSTLPDTTGTRAGSRAAQRLRTTMAAVWVSLRWFGVRRSLTADQKAQAADAFGAETGFLSAGRVSQLRGEFRNSWEAFQGQCSAAMA